MTADILTAAVWSYFAAVESFGRLTRDKAGVVDNPGLSYGLFHTLVVPVTTYGGVTTQARFAGTLMDIGHQRRLVCSKSNDAKAWVHYNRTRGKHASAMEHEISEGAFTGGGYAGEAISAVKALSIASSEGQKIYTLTQENRAQLANIHQSPSVMETVQAALDAGKEVVIHESPINHAGFSGAGFVITDSATGAGAYLIEGGQRGAILISIFALMLTWLFAWIALTAASGGVLIGLAIANIAFVLYQMIEFVKIVRAVQNSSCTPQQQERLLDKTAVMVVVEALGSFMINSYAEHIAANVVEDTAAAFFDFPLMGGFAKILHGIRGDVVEEAAQCNVNI